MATFEEASPYASSLQNIQMGDLHARRVPDVPEDVNFLMEHLNDPNFDLTRSRPPSFSTQETRSKKDIYASSDFDNESQFDSDRYSISQHSTAVEFEE
jgi:hypothetical protein